MDTLGQEEVITDSGFEEEVISSTAEPLASADESVAVVDLVIMVDGVSSEEGQATEGFLR